MNRNFERGNSRKTGKRGLRKFWKVCAWGLSISMILGAGNVGSYIVTADDGEAQTAEIPAETSEPETETSEEPVFSVSPESTPSPEAAGYTVTEMTPAPTESTQPSESPVETAAPEPSAISTISPETAAPEPSAESTVLPETAEPVSSPVTTEAPASMPEMSFEQKEKTTGITVSVKAEAGTFPEGTTMELSPVEDPSILEDAKQASELQNPSAVAVDITFRNTDGTVIEPQKQIRVTMTSEVIRQAESVDVVHVPDQEEDTSTAVVDQVPDQNLSEEEKPAVDQVVFDADQFSVYAIVYTVDFTFSGYTYSMEGGSSILLSSLADQLGLHDSEHDKDFDINEVTDVSFSNPNLVSIAKQDNDYVLTSLQPFTSAETLTIYMNDGSKYLVDVTDEQFNDLAKFLSSATLTVDEKEITGDTWTVKIEQSYGIKLQFEEKTGLQFDNNRELVYSLPDGVNVEDQDGTFEIKIGQKIIQGNTFQVDKTKRQVIVKFNTNDANFTDLTQSEDLIFYVKFSAQFDKNVETIKFNDTVSRKVTIDTSHHVTVTKTGNFDWNDKKMHYKVTVHSEGHSEDIVVTDTLTGTAVTLDQDSIQFTSNKSDNKKYEVKKTDKRFILTIPEMENDETAEITYTASIDFSKVGNGSPITADKTSNGVKVTSKDNPDPENSAEYKNDIYYSPSTITKEQTSISDINTNGNQKYRDCYCSSEMSRI